MFALSKPEVRQVLAAIDLTSPFGQRDYLLVLFLYHTGLRVGECAGLITHLVALHGVPRQYLHLPATICKNSRGRVVPPPPRRPRPYFKTGATAHSRSAPSSNWWQAIGKRPGLMCAPHHTPFATVLPVILWPLGFPQSTFRRPWGTGISRQRKSTLM